MQFKELFYVLFLHFKQIFILLTFFHNYFQDYDSDFENSESDSSSVSEASDSVSDDEEEIVNQNLESVKDNKIHTNHVFRNAANISSQENFSKEQDDEHAGGKIRVCEYQIVYYNLNFIIKLFYYIFLCFLGHYEELIVDRYRLILVQIFHK